MATATNRSHYMLDLRLDLSSVDAESLITVAGRLRGLGLIATTLAHEMTQSAGADPVRPVAGERHRARLVTPVLLHRQA